MGITINTAFHNIRRSPFQAVAAILILSITFFVGTLLSILVYSSGQAIKYFEKFLTAEGFSDTQAEAVKQEIEKLRQ